MSSSIKGFCGELYCVLISCRLPHAHTSNFRHIVCKKILYTILYIVTCLWCPLFTAIFHNISGNFNKTRYQQQTAGLPSKLQRRSFDFQFPFRGIFLCFNYACNSIGCSVPLSLSPPPDDLTLRDTSLSQNENWINFWSTLV